MNIQDVGHIELPDIDSLDRLELIFAKQAELRVKYITVERGNGFHCPDAPADLNDRHNQHVIKDMAWRIVEELAEAVDAAVTRDKGTESDHAREEIADAFHFLVELAIIAGFKAEQVTVEMDPLYPHDDYLSRLFRLGLPAYVQSHTHSLTYFIRDLGMLCHTLKNKPWKQSHMLTDETEFALRLHECFKSFVVFCMSFGLNPDMLFNLYFRKASVNDFRVRSKY